MGRTSTFAAGFAVGSVVTYFLVRKKKRKRANFSSGTSLSLRGGGARGLLSGNGKKQLQQRSAYALAKLADEGVECVGFLSDIVGQLWPYINVAGSAMVKDMMEPMLVDLLPGTTKFTKLDLGSVPIRLDNVVVHKLHDGKLQFDLDVIWDGDCDIALKSGLIAFGVKAVKLRGRLSMLLCPLTNALPVVSAVQYAFINPPDLELDFTGLAQVADFAVIDESIRQMIQDILSSMVVLPQRMMYKMNLANDFLKTYQPPIGIAKITAVKGRGFQIEKILVGMDDVPDVYLNIDFGASSPQWRTSTVWDDLSPEWNESAHFVLSDHDQAVHVNAWDEDKSPLDPDDDLGSAKIAVGDLLLGGGTAEVELEAADDDGNAEGTGAFVTFSCEVCDLTPDLASFESSEHHGENTLCGVLTILVTRAFNIPLKREEAAAFVKVTYGPNEFFTGAVSDYPGIDGLNPPYDCAFMVPLTSDMVGSSADEPEGDVEFNLMNGEAILGTTTVSLASLAALSDKTLTERRDIGDQGASFEFQLCLRGVQVIEDETRSKAVSIAAEATTPVTTPLRRSSSVSSRPGSPWGIGKVKITALKGRGFKVQKQMFKKDDVPDVYLKMHLGSTKQKWRSSTFKNSITPEWNESVEFKFSDHEESVNIDVYDEDKGVGDSDDFLGSAEISVDSLLLAAKAIEVSLVKKDKKTGAYVTIDCDMVDNFSTPNRS